MASGRRWLMARVAGAVLCDAGTEEADTTSQQRCAGGDEVATVLWCFPFSSAKQIWG